jgi:hypothetical protein
MTFPCIIGLVTLLVSSINRLLWFNAIQNTDIHIYIQMFDCFRLFSRTKRRKMDIYSSWGNTPNLFSHEDLLYFLRHEENRTYTHHIRYNRQTQTQAGATTVNANANTNANGEDNDNRNSSGDRFNSSNTTPFNVNVNVGSIGEEVVLHMNQSYGSVGNDDDDDFDSSDSYVILPPHL